MSKEQVVICALKLIDPQSRRILSAQRWLYAQELSRLLLDMGYAVAWYQLGDGWYSEVIPGVPLAGSLPEESQLYTWPMAANEFWEKAGVADYAIYFDLALAYPQVHEYSLGIAHGIEWNDPMIESRLHNQQGRDEWKRRLWMSLCGPRKTVAVDSGVIQWATATWPGLYHQFVHIPNFVSTAGGAGSEEVADPRLDDDPPASQRANGSSRRREEDNVRIVFWDVLSPQSGIAQTLEAVDPLLKRYPNVEIAIAGRGTSSVEQYVTRWTEERDRATFEPDGAMSRLGEDTILLMPAKWDVGPSLICLQGMASGAAIVIGQTSGLTDFVIHDHNGWVIKSDTMSIREALVALIESPSIRRRLGKFAREVAPSFSLDVWRHRWRRLITTEFQRR